MNAEEAVAAVAWIAMVEVVVAMAEVVVAMAVVGVATCEMNTMEEMAVVEDTTEEMEETDDTVIEVKANRSGFLRVPLTPKTP